MSRMFRLTCLLSLLGLLSCQKPVKGNPALPERPMRVVSMDFCADQYVLKFADREQILALSPDAEREFSFMRKTAAGLPTVRPLAEDVLILQPDLVVRSYGGGTNAASFLERAGVPVLQVRWAQSFRGQDVNSVPGIVTEIANGLGQSRRGEQLVAEYTTRLEQIRSASTGKPTLYMTPAGVTTGAGTLEHRMLKAAGLTNFFNLTGWHVLPLEHLAYDRPELVAAAFFNTRTNHAQAWSAARHPIARRELTGTEVVHLDGSWISCGGWFTLEAVEVLAREARSNE